MDIELTDDQRLFHETTTRFIESLPSVRDGLVLDVQAAYDGDPAASSLDEVILAYPGVLAVTVYPGTVTTNYGTALSPQVVNSPVTAGGTQYVCVGAAVAGNVYAQPAPTNVTLSLANNAALTWRWATNLTFWNSPPATPDPATPNNVVEASLEVYPPAALLATQVGVPDPVLVNDYLTYTVAVANQGSYAVPDLRVVDELPLGTELVSVITSQGAVTNVSGVVEWSLNGLAPGTNATVEVTVVPREPGLMTNTVTFESVFIVPGDPNRVSLAATTVITEPLLTVELHSSISSS